MKMTKTQIFKASEADANIIAAAAEALKNGAVIVMPTDTVYGIVAAADNKTAVERMCAIKQKPLNVPLQYLSKNLHEIKQIAVLPPAAAKLAASYWPGPMTLALEPNKEGKKLLRGFDTLGLRVPDHEFSQRVLRAYGGILAASSANIHGAPNINSDEELVSTFEGNVDFIFTAGALKGVASTVLSADPFIIFREGAIKEADILKILK